MRLNKDKTPLYILTILLFISNALLAQDIKVSKSYPADFIHPLELNPSLAGSFGEIRSNHFHSGLDFRTNQREGYPVYAVADGYISRLRVQIGGFGNALYITHPNGYTSVYAHLQRFNDRITQILRDYQYRKQSFDVDFPLLPIEITVKQGEVVAWSGNTGSSGGPHLHFELRDSQTEETINPQLFGLMIPDQVKPQITGLYMYRLNGLPFTEHTPSQYFQLSGSNGNYILNKNPIIQFSGEIGFGITTFDQQLTGGNKNGVYSIELQLDEDIVFASALERFAFIDSRAINSHIDFPALIRYGRTVQKSFIEPGNPLKIYYAEKNKGIITITDNKVHTIKYLVKDIKGNTSILQFRIQNNPEAQIGKPVPKGIKKLMYNVQNEFNDECFQLTIPKGVLYNDIDLIYAKTIRHAALSDIFHIHNRLTPLHSEYQVWIKPNKPVAAFLKNKLLIANANGSYAGGYYDEKDGYVKGTPRAFGSYLISMDTIPPTIRPLNISAEKSMAGLSKILLKISDNLSGIRTFSGSIDGQWVLMEYDLKTSTLWHTFDYHTAPGKHIFELTVTDMKQNTKIFTSSFYK